MHKGFDPDEGDVERRIEGEFMRRLQESEVPFEITDVMEGLLDEDDFGGKDEIVRRIEEEMIDNDD